MRKKFVFGLAGIVAAGVGLAGCQSSPRTSATSSNTPTAQNATASQGWDKGAPMAQTNGSASGPMGLANRSNPAPAGTYNNIDPNALPRTSQDALPRTMGNQTSSYTTVPNTVADSGLGGGAASPLPSTTSWQRPTPGVTQTGLMVPATSGAQPATFNGPSRAPSSATTADRNEIVLPGAPEARAPAPAPSAAPAAQPVETAPVAPPSLTSSVNGLPAPLPASTASPAVDDFPPPPGVFNSSREQSPQLPPLPNPH